MTVGASGVSVRASLRSFKKKSCIIRKHMYIHLCLYNETRYLF